MREIFEVLKGNTVKLSLGINSQVFSTTSPGELKLCDISAANDS